MEPAVDVAVVGGGLAGLTAARELGRRGRSVVLLEGRDRLGGRAWVSSFAGVDVEMGGAFVHWSQPHLWAEVTRYGLGIVELPEADRALLRRDDGIEHSTRRRSSTSTKRSSGSVRGPRRTSPNRCRSPRARPPSQADLVTTAERDRRPRPRSAEPGPPRRALRRSELGAERPRGVPDDRPVVRPRRLRRADGPGYERPMGARGRHRLAGRRDAPRPARGRAPRHARRGDRAG